MSTDLYELDGFVFGRGCPVRVVDVDRGDRAVTIQDATRTGGLGRMMGRDGEDGPEWTFSLRTRTDGEAEALAAVAGVRDAWARGLDLAPGVVMPLIVEVGGWDQPRRRVYGRPRRFHESSSPASRAAGLADVTCTFQLSDPRSFSDAESSVTLTLVPESTGGLIAPLVTPLTTVARGGVRAGVVTNAGSAPAPVTVSFRGPVKNARLWGDGWEVGVSGTLAYDESITVDALTGSVTNQAGAAVGGRLSRATRLRNAALVPGVQEIHFEGADATGTATATVSWRDASWGL